MQIIQFIEKCARLSEKVIIHSIGNLVSVTKDGHKEPDHIVECSSMYNADIISDKLEEIYLQGLAE